MSTTLTAEREYLTLGEAAEFCRLGLSTIKKLIRSGELPSLTPIKRRRLVRRVDLISLMERPPDGSVTTNGSNP